MTEASPLQRARRNLTGIVSTLVTGIWLAALFTDQDWWLAFMLFGYVVVVPVVALLFGDEDDVAEWWEDDDATESTPASTGERDRERSPEETTGTGEDAGDALATLRERYARGELTDEQFERKVERLLETETLEDVEDRARGSALGDDASSGSDVRSGGDVRSAGDASSSGDARSAGDASSSGDARSAGDATTDEPRTEDATGDPEREPNR